MQDRIYQVDEKPLAPRGRTIRRVKSGNAQNEQMLSALLLKADSDLPLKSTLQAPLLANRRGVPGLSCWM